MLATIPEIVLSGTPDRLVMFVPGLNPNRAMAAGNLAASESRKNMPKATGESARRIQPLYGKNYFGVRWLDPWVYYQEKGIRGFTMKSLAGKTVPMWIKDPTGQVRAKNPKAEVRTRADGVIEVKIFRKVARIGQRRQVYRTDPVTGIKRLVDDKPASYPGAPGRIANREGGTPAPGKVAGQIASGNIGVRWYHPGIAPRLFLNNAMAVAAQRVGIIPVRVYVAEANWRSLVHGAEYER